LLLCDLKSLAGGKTKAASLLQEYVSAWAVAQGDEPGFAANSGQQKFAQGAIEWLKFHEAMLIGEIVPYLLLYLKHNPAASEHSEFKHVLTDEYQDLNKAEQTIMDYLSTNAEACIVGDDDQSIYSFKFAHPEGIREWHAANPGTADHALDECQRCPTTVVDMANALIANNKNRKPRVLKGIAAKGKGGVEIVQLKTLADEVNWIVNRVVNLTTEQSVLAGEIIILVQRRAIAKLIMAALRIKEVPSKSFYEESQLDSREAQRCFSIFKLFLQPDNRVALRYLPGEGGTDHRAAAYAKLRDYCEKNSISPREAMKKLASGVIDIGSTKSLVARFNDIEKELEALKGHASDLEKFVDHVFPDGNVAIGELRLLAIACLQKSKTPEELLEGMMNELTQPEIPPTVNDVRVMSLNKSKGLSSPYVFIAGCFQGLMPRLPNASLPKNQQDAEMEEQRRLFYVGITRVKADVKGPGTLVLSYSQQMSGGLAKQCGIVPASSSQFRVNLLPSIFLNELGKSAPKAVVG